MPCGARPASSRGSPFHSLGASEPMSEGTIWLVLFAVFVVVFSVLSHWTIQGHWSASLIAAVSAVSSFQFAGYLYFGRLSPIIEIALVIYGIIAMCCAMIIGNIVRRWKHRSRAV